MFRKYLNDKVQEEVVTLPRFLRIMCDTIISMLRSYDADQTSEEVRPLVRNISGVSFTSDDMDSSAARLIYFFCLILLRCSVSPLPNISAREYHAQVVELCRLQFSTSGICPLLVEVLRMFCDFSLAHDRDSSAAGGVTAVAHRKSSNPFRSISRYALKGTDLIAR